MSDHEGYNKIEGLPEIRGAFAIMAKRENSCYRSNSSNVRLR